MAASTPKSPRQRADLLLVDRGLVESREQAQALIMAGAVLTPTGPVQKAGTFLPPDTPLELRERLPYVSRGGVKLAQALDTWVEPYRIPLDGITALDVGASTGGFTDCLLNYGHRRGLGGRDAFTRWMWDTASCTTACAPTLGWCAWKR